MIAYVPSEVALVEPDGWTTPRRPDHGEYGRLKAAKPQERTQEDGKMRTRASKTRWCTAASVGSEADKRIPKLATEEAIRIDARHLCAESCLALLTHHRGADLPVECAV